MLVDEADDGCRIRKLLLKKGRSAILIEGHSMAYDYYEWGSGMVRTANCELRKEAF